MRFTIPFLSALLATSVVAYPSEVTPTKRDGTVSLPRAAAAVTLTWNPSPSAQSLFNQYCSSAVNKRSLVATRAQPAGSTAVQLGQYVSATAQQPTLWTGGLGTCVGVAVTGTAGRAGGVTRYLFHVSLGQSPSEVMSEFNAFAANVQASGLTNMNAIMYTVETRQGQGLDPELQEYANDVEPDYANIASALQQLTGTATGRRYRAWSAVGEMTILANNAINPYTS